MMEQNYLSPSRRKLFVDLMSDGVDIQSQLTTIVGVKVIRISGHQDRVPSNTMAVTDWLRILVREEALRDPMLNDAEEAQKRSS